MIKVTQNRVLEIRDDEGGLKVIEFHGETLEFIIEPTEEQLKIITNSSATRSDLIELREHFSRLKGTLKPQDETEIKQEIELLKKLLLVRSNRSNEVMRQLKLAYRFNEIEEAISNAV